MLKLHESACELYCNPIDVAPANFIRHSPDIETSQSLPEFGSLSKLDARVGFSEKSLLAI
jgi:hypothetical protein